MEEDRKILDPCDVPIENPDGTVEYRCPFEGETSESELCRVCCGKGVDE